MVLVANRRTPWHDTCIGLSVIFVSFYLVIVASVRITGRFNVTPW